MDGDLLQLTNRGLYCPAGHFYIDPWQAVSHAVITHAHADHARHGSRFYLATRAGEQVLRLRVGAGATVRAVEYGEAIVRNGVRVSLHPAGHILGSAQVRVEHRGEVWVVSGDYKVEPDPTCTPFEPVPCHTFVTESTFALPVYRWPPQEQVLAEVHAWWRANQEAGRASLLFGYSLGKAQRLLAGLDPGVGPIVTHNSVADLNVAYRAAGVRLPDTRDAGSTPDGGWGRALVVAPPAVHGTAWARQLGLAATGYLSGWMLVRGPRRGKAVDRGFVLSDHADWPGLLDAIRATGAGRVWVMHGYTAVLTRWLREQGLEAQALPDHFQGELASAGAPAAGGAR
jgi:putative mRNA 3-end processing factor